MIILVELKKPIDMLRDLEHGRPWITFAGSAVEERNNVDGYQTNRTA